MTKSNSWVGITQVLTISLVFLASAWCDLSPEPPIESAVEHRAYAVYPGSAFNLDTMADKTTWPYVAEHADGFYNHPVGWRAITTAQRTQIIANFKNKQALLEGALHKTPIVFPGQEGDQIGGEMAALGMSTMGLFENEVAPNKPQDTVPPKLLSQDGDQYREFVRAAKAKLSTDTFFMTAAFQTDGEDLHRTLVWSNPVWDYMRKDILVPGSGGSGLDSPVDNYLYGPAKRRQAVWDMTVWTQRHKLKFIYLVSPGHVNPANFIRLLRQTVASLEDHHAEPDIYGIETYIPKFPLTPEKNADGSAAGTITGGAFYLLKHRDGDPNTLHLFAIDESGSQLSKIVKISTRQIHYRLCISNTSAWLDYAPVLQAKLEGDDDWSLVAKSGTIDVTSELLRGGYLFYQKARLNPNTKQYIDIVLKPKHELEHRLPIHVTFSLMPHTGAHTMDTLEFIGDRRKDRDELGGT